jgi:hypothetical protein
VLVAQESEFVDGGKISPNAVGRVIDVDQGKFDIIPIFDQLLGAVALDLDNRVAGL